MEMNVEVKTTEAVKKPVKKAPVVKEPAASPEKKLQDAVEHPQYMSSRRGKRGVGQKGPQSEEIEKKRERDRKPVRGIFMFKELPGGTLKFSFRAYRNDPIEKFELVDGNVYTLPYGVANHINKNMSYYVHGRRTNEIGNPSMNIGKRVQRAIFSPIEFSDLMVPSDFIIEPSYLVR